MARLGILIFLQLEFTGGGRLRRKLLHCPKGACSTGAERPLDFRVHLFFPSRFQALDPLGSFPMEAFGL